MEEDIVRRTKTSLKTHLDSPLKKDLLLKIWGWVVSERKWESDARKLSKKKKKRYNSLINEMKELFKQMRADKDKFHEDNIGFCSIQGKILEQFYPDDSNDNDLTHYKESMKILISSVLTQIKSFDINKINSENLDLFTSAFNKVIVDQDLMKLYLFKNMLEDGSISSAFDPQNRKHLVRNKGWKLEDGISSIILSPYLRIGVSNNFSLILRNGTVFLGTRDHYLCLSDLFSQRFNLLFSGILAEKFEYDYYLFKEELLWIFQWGDSLLSSLGEEGYDIISKWEAIVTGTIITLEEDKYAQPELFLNALYNDSKIDYVPFMKTVEIFIRELSNKNINKCSQAFGLFRIWGHPTTSSIQGIEKLKKIACKPRKLNAKKIQIIECKFKEYLCLGYHKKHQKYPNLDTSSLMSTSYIAQQIKKNLVINPKHHEYCLRDWCNVQGEETFPIPKHYDISELISDKAMSLPKEMLHKRIKEDGNIGMSYERSVLINWMKSELGDPKDFLSNIDRNGFSESECYVGVCPKEREMKRFARMFALMPLHKRMYVVLTESLIADYILPYFPEITMKDTQSELLMRHYNQTNHMSSSSSDIKIVINSDFEKWNTNMRENETLGVFKFMDQLFGFQSVISRTHELFKGFIYLADSDYDLEVNNKTGYLKLGDLVWNHHLGGLEGMRQKGWTVWTVVILKYCMEETKTFGSIMGQGDNQVIILNFKGSLDKESIKIYLNRFVNFLDQFLKDLGPPLKKEETWISSNFFSYGKFPIYKGSPLCMSQKKIARMLKTSNEGFPTLESSLSSLSASFFDSSSMSHDFLIPLILYTMNVIDCLDFYLYRSPFSKTNYIEEALKYQSFKIPVGNKQQLTKTYKLSNDTINKIRNQKYITISDLILFPRILGGYPISTLGDVMIRGFPDPLSSAISQLNLIKQNVGDYKRNIVNNILSPIFSDYVNYEMLFSDPVALNLLHPSSPGEQLKRKVLDLIKSGKIEKSKSFSNFLAKTSDDQKKLADLLSDMTPHINPRIGHDILECTVEASANKITDRIEKTNTLVNLMVKNYEDDLNRQIGRSEVNYLSSCIYQLHFSNKMLDSISFCATERSIQLRNLSWKKTISGVTFASPFETFQFSLTQGYCTSECQNQEYGHISVKVIRDIDGEGLLKIGPTPPFLGSSTKEKIIQGYGVKFAKDATPIFKRNSKMLRLINWGTESNSNLSKLIIDMYNAVTDIPYDIMLNRTDQISGSFEHRWSTSGLSHGCFLPILYNGSSWINMSTTTLSAYSKGSKNVNLMFQAAMILCESLLTTSRAKEGCVHMHIKCKTCVKEIDENPLDIPENDYTFSSFPNDHQFFYKFEEEVNANEIKRTQLMKVETNLQNYDKDELFNISSTKFVLEEVIKFTLEAQIGNHDSGLYTGSPLPNSWAYKLNIYNWLPLFVQGLLSHYSYLNPKLLKTKDTSLFSRLIRGLPLMMLSPLYTLCKEQKIINVLSSSYGVSLPVGDPPTFSNWIAFIKNILIKLTDSLNYSLICRLFPTNNPGLTGLWNLILYNFFITKKLTYEDVLFLRNIIEWDILRELNNQIDLTSFLYELYKRTKLEFVKELWIQSYNHNYKFTDSSADYWAHQIDSWEPLPESEKAVPNCNTLNPTVVKTLKHPSKTNQNVSKYTLPIPILKKRRENISMVNILRCISQTGSCIYKSIELTNYIRHKEHIDPDNIFCIGDGNGAFSVAFQERFQLSSVYFNTLFNHNRLAAEGVETYVPSEFLQFPSSSQRIKGLNTVKYGISDILRKEWSDQEVYKSAVKDKRNNWIMSDAEFTFSDVKDWINYLSLLIKHCITLKINKMIFKTYMQDLDFIKIVLTYLLIHFKTAKIIRLNSSNFKSYEVYIMCDEMIKDSNLQFEFSDEGVTGIMYNDTLSKIMEVKNLSYDKNKTKMTISSITNKLSIINHSYIENFKPDYLLIPLYGKYPYSSGCDKLSFFMKDALDVTWKDNKFLTLTPLSSLNVKNIIKTHLAYLGGLINNEDDLSLFLDLIDKGSLIIYLTRSGKWGSFLHQKSLVKTSFFLSYQLNRYISRSELKTVLKDIGVLRQTNAYVKVNYMITMSDIRPLSKYRKDKWWTENHGSIDGVPSSNLPVDQYLLDRVMENRFEGSLRKVRIYQNKDSNETFYLSLPVTNISRRLTSVLRFPKNWKSIDSKGK
ncbi:MAG: RNA-dependent RNA polymerase [Hangzhou rhabdovirus 3]|nr:MAG: RNA-dependent RNA polymerase [Hangzhou rhabdovirus 3]